MKALPMGLPMVLNDLDQRIWEEELAEFVPRRVFDVHTHLYRWEFCTDAAKEQGPYADLVGRQFPLADWDALEACDRALLPGREVHRLSFGLPFPAGCDFDASNRFVAEQSARDPRSAGLMLVHPDMTHDKIERTIRTLGLIGLKPYRFYSVTGDAAECRITDFLPEHQIAVADRLGLIVVLHLAKRDAVADPENLADLERLGARFPRVRWILAHNARSYADWPIRQAGPVLSRLQNVWYDVSSVCDADAIAAMIECVGPGRVMYGSDDLPVGAVRGKYVAFARAWAYLGPANHTMSLVHCDERMTFVRYEQLRAMRRAARQLRLTPAEIQAMFCDTAELLVRSAGR